jgi:hypothetical protein
MILVIVSICFIWSPKREKCIELLQRSKYIFALLCFAVNIPLANKIGKVGLTYLNQNKMGKMPIRLQIFLRSKYISAFYPYYKCFTVLNILD